MKLKKHSIFSNMKAAIYARYSTDKQREASIEDQFTICARRAEREELEVALRYSDDGVSGSTPVARRAGGAQLLLDAFNGRFDVLMVEGLDRLSRDQVEQEQLVRRLEHRGIVIIGVADSYDSRMGGRKIMRGVRGLINEMFLDDLRHKTHRGQAGQVERGYAAGGKSYGYDIVRDHLGSKYQINDTQAGWVRWIFARYAEGWSVQRIAHELNARKVPSPRASTWVVSAIYGSPNKGSGILNNCLYQGLHIWNRSQWVKDPDTGKRQRVDRPREDWREIQVPELRIVDEDLWQTVRKRIDGRLPGRKQGAPVRTLFGGLMVCPYCNGAIIAINSRLYGCANRKDRGPTVCKGIHFKRETADKNLLGTLRDELLSPAAQEQLRRQVQAILAERQRSCVAEGAAAAGRRKQLDGEIQRLVDAIASIGTSQALADRLRAAEAERGQLVVSKPRAGSDGPSAGEIEERIGKTLANLESALAADVQQARILVAELYGRIEVVAEGENIYAEYNNAAEKLLLASSGMSLKLVAGAGFEPTTFGL